MVQHQLSEPVGRESSSVRSLLEAVFRQKRLWLSICAVVAGGTIATVLLSPRKYQSEMSILVENSRQSYTVSPQPTASPIEPGAVTEEQINSEIQILGSKGLADTVVDPQWNQQKAYTASTAQLKAHERAVKDFQKKLSIQMVRKSNVIQVVYTANDPRTATATLTRLMNAFLAKQKEFGHPPGTSQFFASEAARYKTQLDQAQQQLAEFQQSRQIVTLPDAEQSLDRQISDAQAELRSTDVKLAELSKRLNSQVKQAASIPDRQATEIRSTPNDYSVERLNTLLTDLENQRTALLTKFTPKSRMVQQIDTQIATTKAALENARQMRSEERSTDVNPVWQAVSGSIVQNESEIDGLKAQRAQLADQIATLQGNLSGMEGATVDYNTLRQKVSELQTNYQTYSQKRDDAMIADAMDESRLLNVAIAQDPTFSPVAAGPRPIWDLSLGVFTAIFLAGFAVFFAEMGRTAIATPQELEAATGYPLLATVPYVPNSHDPISGLPETNRMPVLKLRRQRSAASEQEAEVRTERERQVQAS